MKSLLIGLMSLMLTPFFWGCNAVYTKSLLGEKPANLKALNLDGTWVAEDEFENVALITIVTDVETGVLEVEWIEPPGNDLEAEKFTVQVREQGDWLVAHFSSEDNPEHYLWFIAKVTESQVSGWVADTPRFRNLVKAGEIDGTVLEGGNVVIEGLSGDALERLITDVNKPAFEWEESLIMKRLVE